MVRVAKWTGLPIGAVMLVGRPVIFSRPRSRSSVPPCGGADGGVELLSSAIAPGLAAWVRAAGGGFGMAGLAGATVAGVWAMAAAAKPSGSSIKMDQAESR